MRHLVVLIFAVFGIGRLRRQWLSMNPAKREMAGRCATNISAVQYTKKKSEKLFLQEHFSMERK
jgi:hypothetical protein